MDQFVQVASADKKNLINDQLLTITRDEIWPSIMRRREFDDKNVTDTNKVRRLTEALAQCLADYANDNANRHLPFPVPLNLNGGDYRDNKDYNDVFPGVSYVGRYPFTTDAADVIIPGTVATKDLFEKNFSSGQSCASLVLTSPGGTTVANLKDTTALERQMWNNWKDHIFYAVSFDYAPSASLTLPSCGKCVQVSGVKYAAVVIYSGQKIGSQIRQAPIASIDTGIVADTKKDLNNYIEVVNPKGNGQGDYTPTANDTIFCLTDTSEVKVVPCM